MLEIAVVLATLLATPQEAAPRVGGAGLPSGGVVLEVLPHRTEREIRTPEGFIREEEPDPDPRAVGSFGIYHIDDPGGLRATAAPVAAAERLDPDAPGEALPSPGEGPETAPADDPSCRTQRQRYLRRLWRSAGIDVERPLDLLDGLGDGAGGPPAGALAGGWLAGVDPIRPLAWDAELRSLARDLVACQGRQGAR